MALVLLHHLEVYVQRLGEHGITEAHDLLHTLVEDHSELNFKFSSGQATNTPPSLGWQRIFPPFPAFSPGDQHAPSLGWQRFFPPFSQGVRKTRNPQRAYDPKEAIRTILKAGKALDRLHRWNSPSPPRSPPPLFLHAGKAPFPGKAQPTSSFSPGGTAPT